MSCWRMRSRVRVSSGDPLTGGLQARPPPRGTCTVRRQSATHLMRARKDELLAVQVAGKRLQPIRPYWVGWVTWAGNAALHASHHSQGDCFYLRLMLCHFDAGGRPLSNTLPFHLLPIWQPHAAKLCLAVRGNPLAYEGCSSRPVSATFADQESAPCAHAAPHAALRGSKSGADSF